MKAGFRSLFCASYWIPGRELQVSIRTPLLALKRNPAQTILKKAFGLERRGLIGEWRVTDKTFLVRFKWATYLSPRPVLAARAEIIGEHLVLLNSEGKLAAIFLLEIVESWAEVKWNA